jgi:hypothetical protein
MICRQQNTLNCGNRQKYRRWINTLSGLSTLSLARAGRNHRFSLSLSFLATTLAAFHFLSARASDIVDKRKLCLRCSDFLIAKTRKQPKNCRQKGDVGF